MMYVCPPSVMHNGNYVQTQGHKYLITSDRKTQSNLVPAAHCLVAITDMYAKHFPFSSSGLCLWPFANVVRRRRRRPKG